MNKAAVFLALTAACAASFAGLLLWSGVETKSRGSELAAMKDLTRSLRLTDLSFANDARYTRHPSQADIFSAFQDQPGSIDHFPSGSVTAAPDFSNVGTRLSAVKR